MNRFVSICMKQWQGITKTFFYELICSLVGGTVSRYFASLVSPGRGPKEDIGLERGKGDYSVRTFTHPPASLSSARPGFVRLKSGFPGFKSSFLGLISCYSSLHFCSGAFRTYTNETQWSAGQWPCLEPLSCFRQDWPSSWSTMLTDEKKVWAEDSRLTNTTKQWRSVFPPSWGCWIFIVELKTTEQIKTMIKTAVLICLQELT